MFCKNCGNKLNDHANFCTACGSKVESDSFSEKQLRQSTNLVPAKCVSCGGSLNVDPTQEAAVCPFCNTPFIVEKAINNYSINATGAIMIDNATVNIQGAPSVSNLLARAKDFENNKNYLAALDYYNKVLDLDVNNSIARQAVSKLKNASLASVSANMEGKTGTLKLKNNCVVFESKKGKETVIYFSEIQSVYKGFLGLLVIRTNRTSFFKQNNLTNPNGFVEITFGIQGGKKVIQEWIALINDAMSGNYHSM